jgi:type IV pilus assembly protein PilE
MNSTYKQRGLTLIELIVVMIIVGVLAAVAIPSYRNYVLRSQRSDAKDALLALSTQLEKYYLQCNSYTVTIADATNCAANEMQAAAASENGWYVLDVDAPAGPLTITNGFVAKATAVNGENQWQDTACREFRIDQAGVREADDADGTDNTGECWR